MKENALKFSFTVRWFRVVVGLLLFLGGTAFSQTRYTPSELDTLVSTIALYPDPLLVHVLNATTHGDDLPNAYAFANSHRNLKGDDLAKSIENAELDYDESVVALIPFPDVLYKLSKYATWANQLGEAVEMQKADVMDAVQRMRKVAQKNGYLKSDDKVSVTVDDNVSIQPVREEYVYVPEYDPRVVYYIVSDGNLRIRYVNGVWIGAGLVYWGWDPFVYDWVHRRPHYRHPHRYAPPRPRARQRLKRSWGRPSNPPPRPNSAWERRAIPPSPPTQSLNKRSEVSQTSLSEPSRINSTSDRRSTSLQPTSNPQANARHSAPPPPSNYKRPLPPPPQASSSDDDEQSSRWDNRSRHDERRHGSHNSPPPPPHRRR